MPQAQSTKVCSSCEFPRTLSEFHKTRSSRDGLAYICKTCQKIKDKLRDPTKKAAKHRLWRLRNLDAARASARQQQYKYSYGMLPGQFEAMMESQCGLCAICLCEIAPKGRGAKTAHVDHCHKTGNIRALLCNSCNQGLGFFRDSQKLLLYAAQYLSDYSVMITFDGSGVSPKISPHHTTCA